MRLFFFKAAPFVWLLSHFLVSPLAAQTMYKCVQDGKNTYQTTPCPALAKQDISEIKVKTPSSGVTVASPDVGGNGDVERTLEFMSTYQACADGVKMFSDELSGYYQQWRLRNAAVVSRIEKDSALQAQFQKKLSVKRNGKAGMCRPIGLELRGVKE